MTQSHRLSSGGRVDRSQPLNFTLNGKEYQGYVGDTLASALLANGVRVVGRSFKLHRPRGIVAAGPEEPNAIMQVGSGDTVRPDQRATQVELHDGLEARTAASLGFDFMSVNNLLSNFLPAGFYYKTFKWPRESWPYYERQIRKAAGLGYAPEEPDPARYDKMNTHTDVLVVGSGPAGLAAALAAGRSGARVILADEQAEFGGSLLHSGETINDQPAADWCRQVLNELESLPEVRLLKRATVFGHYDHNFLGIVEDRDDFTGNGGRGGRLRHRYWRVRARRVIHATGAQERPLVFANNDRPGVMTASAVSTYVNRYGVLPGFEAVIFTNNDSAYQTVLDLQAAGADIACVVDVRSQPDGDLPQKVREAGVTIHDGSVITNVSGGRHVKQVEVRALTSDGVAEQGQSITCDLVANSGGWSPVVHLHCHAGALPVWDDALGCFLPPESAPGQCSAGSVTGVSSLSECLEEGTQAGEQAVQALDFETGEKVEIRASSPIRESPIQPMWLVPKATVTSRGPMQFVDYQNDTTAADIHLAVREGYESVQHVKRYTAMGFGTDQGKLGNINGMGILAEALGQSIPETGTTTFRPAYTPVSFGAMTGRSEREFFDPVRKTAMHEWHVEQGALFENVGQWKRAWYYPAEGETMQQSLDRECLTTRKHVGVLDGSTLGKIEVHGPDANEFLELMYTGGRRKMKVGTCRYGLMLHEDGMIFDDGVTVKLDENHYLLTTTSGGAAGVLDWLELWHQTQWPDMKVFFTSTTDQWATISINGPDSRKLLETLCDDIDLSREAFPFMRVREGTVAGVPARIFRVSFTGELTFEVNVNANYGRHVWEAVMKAGKPYGITPWGTESMHILRAEKGFIVAGQDTDGTMTPMDMNMAWAIGKKKKDFLGMRSLKRPDILKADRRQLVGLKTTQEPETVLPEGAQMVTEEASRQTPSFESPVPMEGYVTSSYYSAILGHSIAFAMIKGGLQRHGEKLYAPLADGRIIEAEITDHIFYDQEGVQQNV